MCLCGAQIPEYCHGTDEESVSAQAFPLVFALDEVISIGYKENLTLQQVRTFTEMDSHEEKLQKIIKEVCYSLHIMFGGGDGDGDGDGVSE